MSIQAYYQVSIASATNNPNDLFNDFIRDDSQYHSFQTGFLTSYVDSLANLIFLLSNQPIASYPRYKEEEIILLNTSDLLIPKQTESNRIIIDHSKNIQFTIRKKTPPIKTDRRKLSRWSSVLLLLELQPARPVSPTV